MSVLTRPFLTEVDSRAEVKGSIDPLGTMSQWVRFGRRIVGNLTTVSSSVRDFKTLLVGFAFIEDLKQQARADQDVTALDIFLRWEQLAGYVRYGFNGEKDFRGSRRVRARWNDTHIVPLSKDPDCQILGSQKPYGLWGLYTVPARSSGLLTEDNALTDAARTFLEKTWRRELKSIWPEIRALVSEDNRRVNVDKWTTQLKRLSRLWSSYLEGEREFWRFHLVEGGAADPTAGRQKLLSGLLHMGGREIVYSPQLIEKVSTTAASRDEVLAQHLADIAALERVFAPAVAVFAFLQQHDGRRVEEIVTQIEQGWPAALDVDLDHVNSLRGDVAAICGDPEATLWVNAARSLREGEVKPLVETVLAVNASAMSRRDGSSWVVEEGGVLRVRYRDEASPLPPKSEIPKLWRHPYFIDALRSVTLQLEAA